ncbi:MAG: dicarboxylate/amino acid:cation symporter [Bacteroidales bacterium]|nr:dicarboxylate/amino acid:cation symporter [Bacteroidales bacterium]
MQKLIQIKLHWQIFIALVWAIVFGYFFSGSVRYVSWMGDLFLNALKMIIIPLIICSLISAVTNMGTGKNLGRIGLKTLVYYIMTSLLAILTGLILFNIIRPGKGSDLDLLQDVSNLGLHTTSFGETMKNIIPTNIFRALAEGNILSVIFFALLFGFFITRVGNKSRNFLTDFFNAAYQVMMKLTLFIIKFTPLGVFGIVAKVVADNIDQLSNLASSMGIYMLTVIIGLTIHATITLPLILRFIGKSYPLKHFKNVLTPLLTAFSTSSAAATLPLTMEAVEKKSGVSQKISNFTLPLGATINMDGTALYECVAAMFIAKIYGLDLSITQQVLVIFTALLASIGAASVPMAGLLMITIILSALGLPLEGVGLILAVDRPLDMIRTATNVWSDSTGAAVIARSEGEQLKIQLKSS